jgi:hypothetical protein
MHRVLIVIGLCVLTALLIFAGCSNACPKCGGAWTYSTEPNPLNQFLGGNSVLHVRICTKCGNKQYYNELSQEWK